jgi:sulfate adenylyltransferase subunit 1
MTAATLADAAIHASPAAGRALRFLTCGSVDDGKSTLIGRLLMDCQAILADQLDTLAQRAAGAAPDLSLLTDGLEAEREQGITIDVAYRYFATRRRKFVIADAPGHEQYTRNMVTAAAGSDAAVVLVDITKLDLAAPEVPLLPQTRRHALLAHLLRVRSLVFAVNKIDAVPDPAAAFAAVSRSLERFAVGAGLQVAAVLPVSALRGDNVVAPLRTGWWTGPSLLQVLETLPVGPADGARTVDAAPEPLMIPVQLVVRHGADEAVAAVNETAAWPGAVGANPQRVFWGRVARGAVRTGDTVQVLPGGGEAVVVDVRVAGEAAGKAGVGTSAGLVLDRPLDVSRGDWLVAPGSAREQRCFDATLSWLDTEPAVIGRRYWLRHGHRWLQARLTAIHHRLDIHSLAALPADRLGANDIARVSLELQQPLPLLAYRDNPVAGAAILVDPASHRTAGALLVETQAAAAEDDAWAA